MQAPAIPVSEARRIATLHDLLILDTPPESRFDNITAYASSQFAVSMALVSLVDRDRQWFKSARGMDGSESPRSSGICGHAILHDEVFEVPDTLLDERFADIPLVAEKPHVRFYAGAPLIMGNGERVGTLCLMDGRPRRLDQWEREHLQTLARLVAMELQGQSAAADLTRLQKSH